MTAPDPAISFTFGDTRDLNARLLQSVRDGLKTASCGTLCDFQNGDQPMPQVGRRDIALDWDGNPALRIETTQVAIHASRDVPDDFALAEGEGSAEEWRQSHIAYFTRNGGFDPDMLLICERFRLIEVLA